MTEVIDTQIQTEANPTGATNTTLETNQGNNTHQNVTGRTYTQKQYDDAMAGTRGATERETKKKLLAMLGLKADEESKLQAFKEAYENSLTAEEKTQAELTNLQQNNLVLAQELEEKDYIIKALIELTGKNENDVDKIVKMAKGLKTDDNTIEEAIKEVISMVNVDKSETKPTQPVENVNIPHGQQIQQPSTTVVIDTQENPFKAGSINLTKQGQLIRENPELAKKLAFEAGVNLKF